MRGSTSHSDVEAVTRKRFRITVRGAVQGVGFRPFVFRRASALGLSGWVGNSTDGVIIQAEGDPVRIAVLIETLKATPPPHAVIESLEVEEAAPQSGHGFEIHTSQASGAHRVHVLPDLATCEDCVVELFDSTNRRYLYPFINCTCCGPRYSIIEGIPYDRTATTMRRFALCSDCRAEYETSTDRRFHAEPNACPHCGPRLALWDARGTELAKDHDALLAAAAAVRRGNIVAVKGIGGFHLVVTARDQEAVQRLRARKRREWKPFAVMFPSLSEVTASCAVAPEESALLLAPARPIVLLRKVGDPMAEAVAPSNPWLGALLPYTPLHHLLMREIGSPVVVTSGNVSEEPIVFNEHEALSQLAGIADLFLVHDRPIVRAVDDSVVRVVNGRALMLRRARGYAPAILKVNNVRSGILAVGGHLKTTVALTRQNGVILSQHLGDLETLAARDTHAQGAADITQLHGVKARLIVRDMHPDYASSRMAEAMPQPCLAMQHHLAHVVACMAEHGLTPPVLGVAWDGTGYGPDGTIWGGEFLLITAEGWQRVAHLRAFRLPGGEAAVREPRRAALGLLFEAFGEKALDLTELSPVSAFSKGERRVLRRMLTRRLNAPLTTSAGRLFDGFSALCGLRQRSTYEGQAASELEWAAAGSSTMRCYDLPLQEEHGNSKFPLIIDWTPALEKAIADLGAGISVGAVAQAVHAGLAKAIAAVAGRIGEHRVVLSGGCFQNGRLTADAVTALESAGFKPFWHQQVPPNDGGLALGQAVWAAWSERHRGTPCA